MVWFQIQRVHFGDYAFSYSLLVINQLLQYQCSKCFSFFVVYLLFFNGSDLLNYGRGVGPFMSISLDLNVELCTTLDFLSFFTKCTVRVLDVHFYYSWYAIRCQVDCFYLWILWTHIVILIYIIWLN